MRIRSHGTLDFPLAWRRVRGWARGGGADIPDRLPFEILDRLYPEVGPPAPVAHHHVAPVTLVTSSKKSGLARPFARLSPTDLTLYQALVDRLAPSIEAVLAPRNVEDA